MKSPNKAIITLGLSTSIILFLVVVRFGSIKKLAEQYIAYYELNHPLRDSESKIIDEKEIVIPFHYAKFGYIIVPVEINGHQQQFILDTGCTYSSLFQQIAPKFAKVSNTTIDSVILGNEITNDSFCIVPEIRLNTLSFHDMPMKTIPAFMQVDTEKVIGLLGSNILKSFVVTVDYKRKTIVLSKSDYHSILSSDAVVLPFIKDLYGLPWIEVSLNDKLNLSTVADTGSPYNYASALTLKPVLKEEVTSAGEVTGVKSKLNYGWAQLESMKLSSYTYFHPIFRVGLSIKCQSPAIRTVSGMDAITIGNDFFSQFKTTFDYCNKRLILEPYASGVTALHSRMEGAYYLAHGNPAKAIKEFKKAMVEEPEFAASGHANCGDAHVKSKDYQKAIQDYSAAILLDSKDPSYCVRRAYTYLQIDNYKKAIDDCTSAIKIDPLMADAYINRACAYGWLGQNQKAIQDCTKTISLDSQFALAYQSRALGYAKLGQYNEAIKDCDKAISLDRNFLDAYDTRGTAYLKLADYGKSLDDFKSAIKLDPKDTSAYYNRGCAFRKMSKYEQAIDDYNKVINFDPKFAAAYHDRAICYHKIGKHKSALEDELKASKLRYKTTEG